MEKEKAIQGLIDVMEMYMGSAIRGHYALEVLLVCIMDKVEMFDLDTLDPEFVAILDALVDLTLEARNKC